MRDHLREIQFEGLGEVPLEELEGEMEEDSIPKPLWKEIREIGRKRNHQVLQVMGEKEEIFLFPPLQFKNHIKGSHPLLPHLRIDFSWTRVA